MRQVRWFRQILLVVEIASLVIFDVLLSSSYLSLSVSFEWVTMSLARLCS